MSTPICSWPKSKGGEACRIQNDLLLCVYFPLSAGLIQEIVLGIRFDTFRLHIDFFGSVAIEYARLSHR